MGPCTTSFEGQSRQWDLAAGCASSSKCCAWCVLDRYSRSVRHRLPELQADLMKRILIVHNLLEGQKIVHELDDKDFAIELVEGENFDENDDLDIESRLFFKVD